MVELSGICTFGEWVKVGFAGTCTMRVCTRVRAIAGGRQYALHMCNWYAVIFFPPCTSSKDITTRLHAVPPISPPSLLFSLISPLSSIAHSPVLRRHQQEEVRYCSTVEALRSPPLLVRCHSTICVPSCHKLSLCLKMQPWQGRRALISCVGD